MVCHCTCGVQVYILCKFGTRIHDVDNFIGVLNKNLSLSYE
jgi:hypothetical protein